MIEDWIIRENLKAFCEVCAVVTGYNYTELDWDAISHGVDTHHQYTRQWFEYAFEGISTVSFRFTFEPQGGQNGIVMINIEAPSKIKQQLSVIIMIMQDYILQKQIRG